MGVLDHPWQFILLKSYQVLWAHMTYKLPPRHTSTRNLPGKDPRLISTSKPQTLKKVQKSSHRVPQAAITLGCYFTPQNEPKDKQVQV